MLSDVLLIGCDPPTWLYIDTRSSLKGLLQIHAMADVPKLIEAASRWQANFNSPLPLGANAKLAIITCMDSRYAQLMHALHVATISSDMIHIRMPVGCCSVHPERMFDLKIGDAEVLRNAGGRVTMDMIRSACKLPLVICSSGLPAGSCCLVAVPIL